MTDEALLYGATGYVGGLIARRASERDRPVTLAGRSRDDLAAVAGSLEADYRVFSLDDPAGIDDALADVTVVLNCVGPFSLSNRPLVEGCLRTGTHYLDIAGEVPAVRTVAGYDERAGAAGVSLLPGAGFGVVPTDCLAASLADAVPSARTLRLAFQAVGGASQGTLRTLLGDLHTDGVVRRDGSLVPERPGTRSLCVDFGAGPVDTVSNPWRADLFTAGYSTDVPTVETYSAFPRPIRWLTRRGRIGRAIWGSRPMQGALDRLVDRRPDGPDASERESGETHVWGEVESGDGTTVAARLHGPEAYEFTVRTALELANRVRDGDAPAGFQTPATAYGAEIVTAIDGVTVEGPAED